MKGSTRENNNLSRRTSQEQKDYTENEREQGKSNYVERSKKGDMQVTWPGMYDSEIQTDSDSDSESKMLGRQ